MTSHERWVVYPLLLLTLGIAMRDKIVLPRLAARELKTHAIRCNELDVGTARCGELNVAVAKCRVVSVIGPDGTDGVRLGVIPDSGGRLEICGGDGKIVVASGTDQSGGSGMLETFDAEGVLQVRLMSTPAGGAVTTMRHDKERLVLIGHAGREFGVLAGVPKPGQPIPLELVWKAEMRPSSDRPPKKTPENRPREDAGTQDGGGSGERDK